MSNLMDDWYTNASGSSLKASLEGSSRQLTRTTVLGGVAPVQASGCNGEIEGACDSTTESGRDIVELLHEIVTSPGSPSLAGSATVSMCSPTVASSAAAFGLHASSGSPDSAREEAKGDDKSSPSLSGDRPSGSQIEEALKSLLGRITKAELPEMEEEYGQMKEAQVLYPYAPQEEDELLLNAGERVYLLGLSQPEWYVAVRASVSAPDIGLVPQNYVKLL
jgi:hypothetical protein